MNYERREKLINDILLIAKQIRQTKGVEYTEGDDVNAVFYQSNDLGIDEYQAVGILMDKHYKSIRSYIATKDTKSNEPIEGRIVDLLNYLLILYSLIQNEKLSKISK